MGIKKKNIFYTLTKGCVDTAKYLLPLDGPMNLIAQQILRSLPSDHTTTGSLRTPRKSSVTVTSDTNLIFLLTR